MTKLDELMLTGKWLRAIVHVRDTALINKILISKAILYVGLRAYQLGILHTAPKAIIWRATSIDRHAAA